MTPHASQSVTLEPADASAPGTAVRGRHTHAGAASLAACVRDWFGRPEAMLRVWQWTLLVAVVAFTRADPDLWGHVLFGLDILRDGIHHTDPYSFTSDRPWVNHEWAAEVFMGLAWRLGGAAGLIVLKLLAVGGAVVLLCRTLAQDGVDSARARDLLAGLAVITTVQQAHHVRPQLFSLLFFALLLACLLDIGRGRRRTIVALPALFAAWVNFHGGWIVGGGVLAVWTAGVVAQRGVRSARVLFAAGIASFLATAINPYGPGMWQFLRETVGFGRADITDWQPIYALDASVWILWGVTAVLAAAGSTVMIRRRAIDVPRLLVVALLGVGAFRVNRLLVFFALAVLFLLGRELAQAFGRVLNRQRAQAAPAGPASRVVAGTIGAVFAALTVLVIWRSLMWIRLDPRMTPPPGAIELLRAQPLGRLIVWFGWGEYAIWHLAPAVTVSTDGRRETVYSAAMHDRHLRFFFDGPGGAALPAELGADYIWLPVDLAATRRLEASREWSAVYRDEASVVFMRAGVSVPSPVPGFSANGEQRAFPGP